MRRQRDGDADSRPSLPVRAALAAALPTPGWTVLLSLRSMKAMLACAEAIDKGETAAVPAGILRVLE